MIASDKTIQEAVQHLSGHDPVLAPIISQAGLCTIRPHNNYYSELVDAIISQQLSVKAAAAIERRFQDLFGGKFPAPHEILQADPELIRACGISRPKVAYIRDLAEHVQSGKVLLDRFDDLSNDEIIAELTAVKGIGEWTVHMFLMFCMGRLDILPVGDLGIRNGIRALYGLTEQPTADDIHAIAEKYNWHPYESVASWYVWRSLNNLPA